MFRMSQSSSSLMWTFVGVVFVSFGIAAGLESSGQKSTSTSASNTNSTTPSPEKTTTTEIDHFDRDHPVNITVIKLTPYNVTASWSVPNHEDQVELENFVFIYYKTRMAAIPAMHKEIWVDKNSTTYTIRNLKPGTSYSFQVKANYSQGHLPYSIIYTRKTHGYGEDTPCKCNPVGTKRTVGLPCDQITGQCSCIDKHTHGRTCDRCHDGYIWSNFSGCLVCNCDKDRSNGTCHIDPDSKTAKCNCLQNFGGYRCKYCAVNYYGEGKSCLKCKCNGNTKKEVRACDYKTGVCKNCLYNTTGDHCQTCKDGYAGDAIVGKNCTRYEDLPHGKVQDSATFGEVFHYNMGTIVGICSAVVAVVVLIVGLIVYRHWWRWRRRPLNFWTVQLKEDHVRVSFSPDHPSYHDEQLPDVVRYYDQPNNGWTQPEVKVSTGRSRTRTHAGGDSSNPYRSLEES